VCWAWTSTRTPVVACVRTPGKGGRREQTTRTFKTMTVDLMALRDWLVAMGVTRAGMESTGVYYITGRFF